MDITVLKHMAAQPIPVAARYKAWVCGRSLAGISGSKPTGGMDIWRENVL
jgi:hypothetical protein